MELYPSRMLWHVKDTNLALLGSVPCLETTPKLTEAAHSAYANAQRIVFETDLDTVPNVTVSQFLPGEKLSTAIPPALFAETRRLWLSLGALESELERTKPWWVALRLIDGLLSSQGLLHENGVDRYLWNKARADRRQIVTLEPLSYQHDLYANAPKDEQIRFLARVVQHPEQLIAEYRLILQSWRDNNPAALLPIIDRHLKLFPRLAAKLLLHRPEQWLPEILGQIKDGIPTLVVLGTLNLAGPAALPSLLQARNFTTELAQ